MTVESVSQGDASGASPRASRRLERRHRRALAMIGVAALCVGTLSSGGFGDARPYVDNNQTTNLAALNVSVGNQAAVSFTTSISNLYPDDATATDNVPTDAWEDRVVRVTNTSPVVTTLSLQVSASAGGATPLIADATAGARIQVWRCRSGATDTPIDYVQALADDAPTCSGSEQSLLAESDLPLASSTLLASLPANTNANLRIRIRLPQDAPDTVQNNSATLVFTARLSRAGGAV